MKRLINGWPWSLEEEMQIRRAIQRVKEYFLAKTTKDNPNADADAENREIWNDRTIAQIRWLWPRYDIDVVAGIMHMDKETINAKAKRMRLRKKAYAEID